MVKNIKKFFDIFVKFYNNNTIEKASDELINQYEYKIDPIIWQGWISFIRTVEDLDSLTFDDIKKEDIIRYHLPEEIINIELNSWQVLIDKLALKLHETAEALQPLCNEHTKVNYVCSIMSSGIDVMTYMYLDDILEGQNIENNKYYKKAKRIVLDFFKYVKQLKVDFDKNQINTINAQTYEVRRPKYIDDDKQGTFVTIDNAEIHGFGKGTDPDTTNFNKYLFKYKCNLSFDMKLSQLLTN